MRLALADVSIAALENAAAPLRAELGADNVLVQQVDVSDVSQMEAFRSVPPPCPSPLSDCAR